MHIKQRVLCSLPALALSCLACGDASSDNTPAATEMMANPGSSSPSDAMAMAAQAQATAGRPVDTAGTVGRAASQPGGMSGAAGAATGTAGPAATGNAASGGTAGSTALASAGTGASQAGPAATAGASAAAGAAAASAGAAGGAGGAADPSSDECDHACLLDVMKTYQDALVAQDASTLKVSADVKYSENGVVQKLGETMVWKSVMSLVPDTILNFADTTEGNVASQFVYNDSSQKIYQVRLKVVKHEITEIETMIVMQGDQFYNPEGMKVEPVFLQPIDPAKRMTREELKAVTELYLDYLEGKKGGSMVPFADTCKRYENGTVTASGLSSFNTQSWSFMLTRRILVIDEETGITWGMFPFFQSASALVVGEAFKIIEGKIEMIQAVMTYMPPHGVWD